MYDNLFKTKSVLEEMRDVKKCVVSMQMKIYEAEIVFHFEIEA